MANNTRDKYHFYLGSNGKPEQFTSRGMGEKTQSPPNDRAHHSKHLLRHLDIVKSVEQELVKEATDLNLDDCLGIQVAFEGFPGIEMAFESLADARKGIDIELLNVKHVQSGNEVKTIATVFVPQGKLVTFERKIMDYAEFKKNQSGNPIDNQKLIDSIQSFRVATIECLWSDEPEFFPGSDEDEVWWEVWLPTLRNRQSVINTFKKLAVDAGLILFQGEPIEFPERTVLNVKGSKKQISSSTLLITYISELRAVTETAEFFDSLGIEDQMSWSEDLLSRTFSATDLDSPYVCVLDTGVNSTHPLLAPVMNTSDRFTVDSTWGVGDAHGHGTAMAGLAAWGDLSHVMDSDKPISITHRLESVKLLRNDGDNEGRPLGLITSDGVSGAEIEEPNRNRVYSMSLSSKNTSHKGRPTSWSSSIDSITSDDLNSGANPRLFAICAGNTGENLTSLAEYPHHNYSESIHCPAQSWNALTVGAYTNKVKVTESTSYLPLAPAGGLSPYSTTSLEWDSKAPLKPEVVFEGGNVGVDRYGCAGLPDLKLLSTYSDFSTRHFCTSEATSAATALASNFMAQLKAQYPTLWPETIRGLTVHSARWTAAMRELVKDEKTEKQQTAKLLRLVGYGVPNIELAKWSANNSLSLVIEDKLTPFQKKRGKSYISTKEMKLHALPWPKDMLLEIGEEDVKMTVTLSYYIEPNPSSRNVSGKYNYPSHQLRFDIKRSDETVKQFSQRLSTAVDQEMDSTFKSKAPHWEIGENTRTRGSVHRDTWRGSAAELAERGHIAIFPAAGWWKNRKKLEQYDREARYSLIVTIEAPESDVDLYAKVEALIAADTEITAEVTV